MTLSASEIGRLRSFRRAARQVRDASIIAQGHDIKVRFAPGDPGFMNVFVRLLEEEPFRSVALAIRLVYLKGEPAFFPSICNLLGREDSGETRDRVAEIRRLYQEALANPDLALHMDDGQEPTVLSGQEIFDHWLYGMVFHQDESRQQAVERLSAWGAHFIWRVQTIALDLAGRILDLDDIVADFLGEQRLPRVLQTQTPGSAS